MLTSPAGRRCLCRGKEVMYTIRENGLIYFGDTQRHMVCWPYGIGNLHMMAEDLHLGNHWFHKNHYDMPKMMVPKLIDRMDQVVSSKDIVRIIRGTFKWHEPSKEEITNLRERTAHGIMNCKRALVVFGGDAARALRWLRTQPTLVQLK